jgi:hypothetical protein
VNHAYSVQVTDSDYYQLQLSLLRILSRTFIVEWTGVASHIVE